MLSEYYKIILIMKRICRKTIQILRWIITSIQENFYFFYYRIFVKKPHVLSFEETINKIVHDGISVSRYGDGEMRLIMKTGDTMFQHADKNLSADLIKCFNARADSLLVCYQLIPLNFPKQSLQYKWYKHFLFNTYRKSLRIVDKNYIYGNSSFTRFYHPSLFGYTDFNSLELYVKKLKEIWNNKNLLIVEGSESKLGIGNDLFNNCLSIKRIICPKENAYDYIDKIYDCVICKATHGELILVALGPTASVLCTRLAINTKLQAIDIGHIDVVYLWFKNKCNTVCRISGKYVNEAKRDSKIIEISYDDKEYQKQIIAHVC